MGNENGSSAPGIVDDLTVELQQWDECGKACGVAERTVELGHDRMRAARTESERDFIRAEVRGFFRRLALGMLAIALPGDEPVEIVQETQP